MNKEPLAIGAMENVVDAAILLIGCKLVRITDAGRLEIRIIETEAYHQSEPGSHAYSGPKGRAVTMFGKAGIAYVYLIYGMYHCLNVVAGMEGEGAAVLIRAAEPVSKSSTGKTHRKPDGEYSGPGKLCRELSIDRTFNGLDLTDRRNGRLWLLPRIAGDSPVLGSSTRIGLSKGKELMWRFYEKNNAGVSRIPKCGG